MKRFATIICAAAMFLGGAGLAIAQGHGGGGHGGGGSAGGFHGGGGNWHGGGDWHGGGGNWHGGGDWHGHGGSHFVFGVGFGAPWWGWGWPYYYYPYYYPSYYYPAYSYPYYDYPYSYGDSGEYIEQGQAAPAAPAPRTGQFQSGQYPTYSYYCPDPAGYYPQVATCAKGWLRVVPQNAPGPANPVPH